ncbi:MAG: Hint domain-containing protein [Leptolyngbyaceae cyanobacterium]
MLNTVPTAPVTVTITPIDAQVTIALTPADGEANSGDGVASLDIVFDPTLDGFDPATDLTQTITVIAADDGISEDEHTSTINHSITSTGDPIYKAENNIPIDSVDVTISGAAVRIDASNLTTVAEGTTTSYDIVLESKPSATVTVKVTPADSQTDVGSGAGVEHVLTFNPADEDFSFSQTVTVTAVANDTSNEGAHTGVINHTVESTQDAAYDGLTLAAVTVNIVEPGMTIVETGGITTVSELGVTDTYSVVLNSAPENEITISILTDDGETKITEINGETVTGVAELTFTPETFNVPQTVTVTGVDDGEVEEVHSGLITHTISEGDGAGYEDTLTLPTVTATVIDCFLTGTRLLTEMGERRVEELKMGDRLQTLDGSLERIKWIGIQTCHPDGHYHPLRTYPIRIKAGALGDNRPVRDLYVSPDHALLVEGLLINAGALENGESIVRTDPKGESFVYYHIELERHSLVMAEGTPAESYLPQKQDRDTFDNGEEYAQLYPHSNMQALMPMRYPRVSSKRQLPRYIAKHLRQIAKDVVLA